MQSGLLLERCLNKLKGHRAVATRYDKRDYIYRGTIDVASIRIWLRDPLMIRQTRPNGPRPRVHEQVLTGLLLP